MHLAHMLVKHEPGHRRLVEIERGLSAVQRHHHNLPCKNLAPGISCALDRMARCTFASSAVHRTYKARRPLALFS